MCRGAGRTHLVPAGAPTARLYRLAVGVRLERRRTMKTRTWNQVLIGLTAVGGIGLAVPAFAGGDKGEGGDAKHVFKMMDTNGDKKVTVDEHAAGARKMFETMDANRDAKVTVDECEAAHKKMGHHKGKHEMSAAEKVKACDTNNDATLSADEHATCAQTTFASMDTDKDGALTRAELTTGHARMMHKDAAKQPAR
jgi:Ca2+-binding EF-hand superfamily protein